MAIESLPRASDTKQPIGVLALMLIAAAYVSGDRGSGVSSGEVPDGACRRFRRRRLSEAEK